MRLRLIGRDDGSRPDDDLRLLHSSLNDDGSYDGDGDDGGADLYDDDDSFAIGLRYLSVNYCCCCCCCCCYYLDLWLTPRLSDCLLMLMLLLLLLRLFERPLTMDDDDDYDDDCYDGCGCGCDCDCGFGYEMRIGGGEGDGVSQLGRLMLAAVRADDGGDSY